MDVTGTGHVAMGMCPRPQITIAEACDLAGLALTVATSLKSERIVSRLRTFRGGLPPRTHDARTLDASLADLYRPSGGTYAPEA